MANKGVKIPVGIELNTKDFVKDITIATSESGKAVQKQLTPAINKAEVQLRKFADIQKQILSTGMMPEGMDSKSFKALQSANNMAESFLRLYSQIIDKGNQFSDVYTTAYANLEQKANSYRSTLQTLGNAIEQTKRDIEQINQAQSYMNDPKSYDAIIQKQDELSIREQRLLHNIEVREQKLSALGQKYYDLAVKAKLAGDAEKAAEYTQKQLQTNLINDKAWLSFNAQLVNVRKQLEEIDDAAYKAREIKNLAQTVSDRGLSVNDIPQFNEDLKYQQQAYDNVRKSIEGVRIEQEKLAQQGQKFTQVGVSQEDAQRIEKAGSSMMQYATAADEAENKVRKFGDSTRTATRHTSTLKRVVSSITKTFKSMIRYLSQIHKHMNKSFDSSQNGMKQALRNIMRYGLGVRSLYFLFRRLRSATKDAFGVMAQQWEPVNKQISSMIQSLNGVKGSLATMLQPLLAGFSAFFNQFMAMLQKVMETIGAFFAFLTGQNYILRAKAGGVDWADHLADKLGQAKDEAEELNKQLAGFDKINNLTTKDNTDSGSGKSDIGLNTVTFEKVALEQLNIFSRLKDMWLKSDFGDLGRLLNEKLLNVLQKIDWDGAEEIGRKIGTCIATAINGFFENDELAYEMEEAIAGWLNTKFATLYEFASRVEWDKIGVFIVTGIKSFFENANFGEWGEAAGALVSGLLEALYVVVTDEKNWELLGQKIIDGINGFMQTMLTKKRVFKGFGIAHIPIYEELNGFQMAGRAVSGFATNLIETLTSLFDDRQLWQDFGQGIANFIGEIDWGQVALDMGGLVLAILKGIFTAWDSMTDTLIKSDNPIARGIGAALKTTNMNAEVVNGQLELIDNLSANGEEAAKAFSDAFKEEYGDDSIAQVIADQGSLDQSLFDDLANNLNSEGSTIANRFLSGFIQAMVESGIDTDNHPVLAIFTGLIGGIKKIFKIHSPSKVMISIAQDIIAGFLNPFNNLSQRFSSIWENAKNSAIYVLNSMRNVMSSIASSIASVMSSVASSVSNVVSNILNAFNKLNGIEVNLRGASSGAILGTKVKIPYLAKGAVIPPNNQFLAMLGDQKSGTNIEAPLETIEQALRNVITEQNINVTFEVQGDPDHIFNIVRKKSNQFTKRTGLNWT